MSDMRTPFTALAAIAASLALASAAIAQPALVVHLDQNARVSLPGAARDVMIGNPAIADVAVLDGRNLLIQGKSFGATSLMVTDARGRIILNTQIIVAASDQGRVSLYRGAAVQTFACAQRCEPAAAGGSAAPTAAPAAAAPAAATP
jgi:Flp pilus assembly secretin CpaC